MLVYMRLFVYGAIPLYFGTIFVYSWRKYEPFVFTFTKQETGHFARWDGLCFNKQFNPHAIILLIVVYSCSRTQDILWIFNRKGIFNLITNFGSATQRYT